MPTVQSLGMSGLPLDSLLSSLQDNENQALVAIQNRQTDATAKLSAYSQLKNAISSVQTAAEAVGKTDAFGALAVQAGSEAFSATADNQAIAGQYSVQVDQLASAQTLVFAGHADRSQAIGTGGMLNITLGNGEVETLDLTDADTSLDGLVKAINDNPDLGVSATLVNDGSDTPNRLLLTSRDTGTEAAAVKIEVTGNAALNDFLGYDAADFDDADSGELGTSGISRQNATDARVQINGITISSASNTIENVIDGVQLTLNQTTTEAASLKLTRDDSAAKKAITDFVSAYNSLQDTIKGLTSYDVDNQKSSPLTGDSVARSVQTRLRDAISGAFDAAHGTSLGQIGITTDPQTGKLQVDGSKLDKALANNLEGVSALFTSGTGLASRVSSTADTFTKTGGTLSTTTDGLSRTITDIQNQYQETKDRIDQRMETYRAQFTALDSMVTQMNSLSSYLTQQFSALSGINNSSK